MDLDKLTGENVLKILYVTTILAFMIERALAVVFEHRLWLRWFERFRGVKELVTLFVAFKVCRWAGFDALALMFDKASVGNSQFITALIVTGGSKGAIKLMQEYLDIRKPETRALALAKAKLKPGK